MSDFHLYYGRAEPEWIIITPSKISIPGLFLFSFPFQSNFKCIDVANLGCVPNLASAESRFLGPGTKGMFLDLAVQLGRGSSTPCLDRSLMVATERKELDC